MKTTIWVQLLRLLLPLLFPILFLQMANAAINSKQNGAWTSASTWEGGVVPTNFQDVVIKAGHTVTRNNAFVSQGNLYLYGTLVYQGNVARSFYPGNDIELQGTLRVEGGTLYADGLVYGNGTFRQTAGTTTFGRAYVVETTDIQGGSVVFQNTNNGVLHLDFLSLKNATLYVNGSADLEVKVAMNWNNGGKILAGTKLRIDDGATLTFDGGNSKHYNDASIFNYGNMYATSGSIDHVSGVGKIYNYGLWEFDVQANAGFFVGSQYVLNQGEILKKGPGGLTFSSSGHYHDQGTSVFHLQQGGADLTTNSTGNELNGLWQIDPGTSLLVFAYNTNDPVPFNPSKFINNGNVYGRVQFVGSQASVLEGSGKYERMGIAKTNAEVILAGSPEVTLEFNMLSGHIVLNQYDLRLGSSAVNYYNNYDSFIKTNGIGSCIRYCAPGIVELFPVGQNEYTPLEILVSPGTSPDFFKVRVTNTFFGEFTGYQPACTEEIPLGVVGANWIVAEQTPGGTSAHLYPYWFPSIERNGFDPSNCTIGRYVSGQWLANGFEPAYSLQPLRFKAIQAVSGIFGVYDAGHEADVNFIPPSAAGNTPVCAWSDLVLHANTSPNADIVWTGPNGYTSSNPDPVLPGIQQFQGGVYTVKAAQYGCPEKQSNINIQVNPLPNASIVGPNQTPSGMPVTLNAYGGVAYAWSTGETTQSITVSPTHTTDYQVSVTSSAGCIDVAQHTVQVSGSTAAHEALENLQKLSVSPNPTADASTLSFDSKLEDGIALIKIIDARGVTLFSQIVPVNAHNSIPIQMAKYPTGIYQITVEQEHEVKTARLLKL